MNEQMIELSLIIAFTAAIGAMAVSAVYQFLKFLIKGCPENELPWSMIWVFVFVGWILYIR